LKITIIKNIQELIKLNFNLIVILIDNKINRTTQIKLWAWLLSIKPVILTKIDANPHPAAGKFLEFKVELLSISGQLVIIDLPFTKQIIESEW
jgi:hypothetical protein